MALPLFQAGKTIFQAQKPVLEGPFFSSEFPVLKTKFQKAGVLSGTGSVETIPHNLGYTPQFFFFVERVPGGRMNLVNNNYNFMGAFVSKDTGDALDAAAYADQDNVYLDWQATSGDYKYYLYVYYDPATDLL